MKQLIVMICMILLGIIIGGIVLGFGDSAETISSKANERIIEVVTP